MEWLRDRFKPYWSRKVRRTGTRDQHQFPRVATIPFFGTVTVKGPESMALNELGESFLFLITNQTGTLKMYDTAQRRCLLSVRLWPLVRSLLYHALF